MYIKVPYHISFVRCRVYQVLLYYLQGEDICTAAVREVKEETAVSKDCKFILQFYMSYLAQVVVLSLRSMVY